MRTCTRCKRDLPPEEFYRNRSRPDGLNSYCKDCTSVYRSRDPLERRENEGATAKRRRKSDFYFANPLLTIKECAASLGVTERSLQWAIKVDDPDKSRRIKRRRRAAEIRAELAHRELVAKAEPCLICGNLITRGQGTYKTCSRRCSELWRNGRYHLSSDEHEKQRRAQARTILKHPEKYRDVQIRWAKAMLSDNPPPPNRRGWTVEGSAMGQAAEEARQLQRDNLPTITQPTPEPDFIDWTEVG